MRQAIQVRGSWKSYPKCIAYPLKTYAFTEDFSTIGISWRAEETGKREVRLHALQGVQREAGSEARPKRRGYSILMGRMKEFSDSYVILLTRECVNWENFSEMAKLVSTYESAIPIYKDEDMNVVIGLAVFI